MLHLRPIALVCLLVALTAAPAAADPSPDFQALAEAGAAYLNSYECPGVIDAQFVMDNLDLLTVIDIRAEFSYLDGHIPGAYHSSLATLLDDLATTIPSHRPYVIAGYSGQTAGQAKLAMVLMGYTDVHTLKWGMSSWHPSLDVWSANCGDALYQVETANQNGNLVEHAFPWLEGSIEERVTDMLANGFRGVSFADIQDNLDDWFIINYFGQDDYEGQGMSGVPGHIPGAYQFTPYASMAMDQMLANIPADMPVVVYGWTGQHESQVVAYLNLLGYEAYLLKWGVQGLFHSDLIAHAWTPSAIHEFPLEVGDPLAAPDAALGLVTEVGNHPNPFNPATTISYRLDAAARVTLRVYDVTGRLVRELVSGESQVAGHHEVTWQGRDARGRAVPSGTYLCRIQADGFTTGHRLQLLK